MTIQLMYDAGSPPEKFAAGEPWAGYLHSVHPFAVWPEAALKEAIATGLLPIWGGPLDKVSFEGANAAAEAHEAAAQVRALGGNRVVVATDVEERAYEADPEGSVRWSLEFGHALHNEGGLWVAYGNKNYLTALARPGLKCAPWFAGSPVASWPVPGWPEGDRGWQYGWDVKHNGKTVDVSTIEAGFPLIHPKTDPHAATELSRAATRHARRLHNELHKRTHPIKAGPRRVTLKGAETEIHRTLGL